MTPPRSSRRAGATKRGFTLVELLVVLIVIGVFSGIMLAEMRGSFEDALIRSGARDIMSGINLASSRAISQNQPHVFQFDRSSNTFVVQPERPTTAADGSPEGGSSEAAKIDERITIEIRDPAAMPDVQGEPPRERSSDAPEVRRPDVIRFFPDGTADSREIVLRDNNNAELSLRINPVTSRVRIVEEPATL